MRRTISEQTGGIAPDKLFTTTDQHLVIYLYSKDNPSVRVEYENRKMYYLFDDEASKLHVNRYLSGQDDDVSFHKVIAAYAIWNANLAIAHSIDHA